MVDSKLAEDGPPGVRLGIGVEHDAEGRFDLGARNIREPIRVIALVVPGQFNPRYGAQQFEVASAIVAFHNRFAVDAKVRSYFAGEALPERAVPAASRTPTAVEDAVVLTPPWIEPPTLNAQKPGLVI